MPKLELVAISGPVEGNHFPLRPGEPLVIGRTNRGVHLPDLAVSVHHARVDWADGQPTLTDLESENGTFVGARQLEPGSAVFLAIGDVVRIGGSQLRLQKAGRIGILPAVGVSVLVGVSALLCFGFVILPVTAREGGTRLVWETPIHTAPGQAVDTVEIPPSFMRRHGLTPGDLGIRYVRDANKDGIDEVWLQTTKQADYLVTFGTDGSWTVLADLPAGCTDRTNVFERAEQVASSWPDIRCGGELWSWQDGGYRVAWQDGYVVWVEPGPKPTAEKPATPAATAPDPAPVAAGGRRTLEPIRVNLSHPDRVMPFLEARGVTEPVHYLVCEGAIPGLAAQARTVSGRLVKLSPGCLTDVRLDGDRVGRPLMVAFSAVGRRALVDDLEVTWGGSADGLWLDADHAALLADIGADPGPTRGATRLEIASEGPPAPFAALPEVALRSDARLLPDKGAPQPPAVTATLLSEGQIKLDPPGCSELTVTANDWRCRTSRLCTAGTTFIDVVESGCGEERTVLRAPYASGTYDGEGSVPVRVEVDAREVRDGRGVVQARVGYLPGG